MTLTRVGKEGCSRLLSRWEIMRKSMIHTHTYVSDPNNICRALSAFFMIVSYCNLTVGHVSHDYPVPSAHLIRRSAPRLYVAIETISPTENSGSSVLMSSDLLQQSFLRCDILPLLLQLLSTPFENRKDAFLSLSFCQFCTNRIDTKTVNVGKTALI